MKRYIQYNMEKNILQNIDELVINRLPKLNNGNNDQLKKLNNDVVELHETFKLVNDMVIQQGDKINVLDELVDETINDVEAGNMDLIVSTELKKEIAHKETIIAGASILAISIPLTSLVGFQITIPISIIGFGGFKLYNLFKDKNY
jgi:t-SNARE complex subunit (syntaxin)